MDAPDLCQKLWDIANYIVGFAVLQSVSFAYALGKDLPDFLRQSLGVKSIVVLVSGLFYALYWYGVWECYLLARTLDCPHPEVWHAVSKGRVVCIGIFMLLPLLILFLGKPLPSTK